MDSTCPIFGTLVSENPALRLLWWTTMSCSIAFQMGAKPLNLTVLNLSYRFWRNPMFHTLFLHLWPAPSRPIKLIYHDLPYLAVPHLIWRLSILTHTMFHNLKPTWHTVKAEGPDAANEFVCLWKGLEPATWSPLRPGCNPLWFILYQQNHVLVITDGVQENNMYPHVEDGCPWFQVIVPQQMIKPIHHRIVRPQNSSSSYLVNSIHCIQKDLWTVAKFQG